MMFSSACIRDDASTAAGLIEDGLCPTFTDDRGDTPLHLVAQYDSYSVA